MPSVSRLWFLKCRRAHEQSARVCARPELISLEDRLLPSITISVDAAPINPHAINPNIYGINAANPDVLPISTILTDLNVPFNRGGGNLYSRYNWQLDAFNHANDFFFESIAEGDGTQAASSDKFISGTKGAGAEPSVTIPTIGWVATLGPNRSTLPSFSVAKYGAQDQVDPDFKDAGNGLKPDKTPIVNDPTDANVKSDVNFQSGWVQHLKGKGVRYYTLDNEPGIWQETHRDVHPLGPGMDEVLKYMTDYATMIKTADPNAQVLGPEEWGYPGYLYSGKDKQAQDKGDFTNKDRADHGNMDYIPYLLQQLKQYQDNHNGQRLLDALTLHFYPQGEWRVNAQGQQEFVRGERANLGKNDDLSSATQLLRNRSTRSLWDPNYVDVSYLGLTYADNKLRVLPRVREWVNNLYPGTALGITEYDWGAPRHMNGATTEADVLGIFGREGVDIANFFSNDGPLGSGSVVAGTPIYNAIKLYRNYDGNRSTFGDSSVSATVPNADEVSAFSALRSSDGALTIIVDNKNLYDPNNPGATTTITVNLANFVSDGTADGWQLAALDPKDMSKSAISHLPATAVAGKSFTVTVPQQSVTLFVLHPAAPMPSGQLQFHRAAQSVRETDGTATIVVDRVNGSTGMVTVAYATSDGSARANSNYTPVSGTLTFAAGETSKSLPIPILHDNLVDDDRTVLLALSNAGGGATLGNPAGATLTIIDSDMPAVPDSPRPAKLSDAAGIFAHSYEHDVDFVTREYAQQLNRKPDPDGLKGWVLVLQQRQMSEVQVEVSFIGSTEYIQNHGGPGRGWVVGMYQSLLNRTPSEAEIQSWLTALGQGSSTFTVALGFAASAERETLHVRFNYRTYLGRDASQDEVNGWVNAFLTGTSNEDMVAGFVGSEEYYNRSTKGRGNKAHWISWAYQDVLFRLPSVAEVNGWLNFLS